LKQDAIPTLVGVPNLPNCWKCQDPNYQGLVKLLIPTNMHVQVDWFKFFFEFVIASLPLLSLVICASQIYILYLLSVNINYHTYFSESYLKNVGYCDQLWRQCQIGGSCTLQDDNHDERFVHCISPSITL